MLIIPERSGRKAEKGVETRTVSGQIEWSVAPSLHKQSRWTSDLRVDSETMRGSREEGELM